jgi:L-asparagine oxygenase
LVELLERKEFSTLPTVVLEDRERHALTRLVEDGSSGDPITDTDAYVLDSQLRSAELPTRLRELLLRLRAKGSDVGGALIRNVPIGDIPPTPAHADLGVGMRLAAAKAMSVIVGYLGEQFGFLPELGGQIVQDILPVPGFEDTQQSISSRAPLELHCETAFTDTRADFIALLCLRPDPDQRAMTLLSPARNVLAGLDSDTVAVLRQPRFSTTVDGSFLRGSGLADAVTVAPIRILTGSPDRPRLRCDFAETAGLDPVAQQAVEALYRAAGDAAIGIHLQAGDLLIIDNHGSFHGRTSFAMTRVGNDRWLLRTFVTRDLARSVACRPGNGRIVHIDYASLAAGGKPECVL